MVRRWRWWHEDGHQHVSDRTDAVRAGRCAMSMSDEAVAAEVAAAFPVPCREHPHGVRVERDRYGCMVYCQPCLIRANIGAPIGTGWSEAEAIADWNERGAR